MKQKMRSGAIPRRVFLWALPALLAPLLGGCWHVSPAPPPPLTFHPGRLPTGQVGHPYQARVEALGGDTPVAGYWISNGNLPPGISVREEPTDGTLQLRLEGTPRQAGRHAFTIAAGCYGTQRTGARGAHYYVIEITP